MNWITRTDRYAKYWDGKPTVDGRRFKPNDTAKVIDRREISMGKIGEQLHKMGKKLQCGQMAQYDPETKKIIGEIITCWPVEYYLVRLKASVTLWIGDPSVEYGDWDKEAIQLWRYPLNKRINSNPYYELAMTMEIGDQYQVNPITHERI